MIAPMPSLAQSRATPKPENRAWKKQRTRLLDAAIRTFSRMGYAEASVADVLAEAGMSRRSFYEHFESKEAILLAIVEYNGERLMAISREAMAAKKEPLERLAAAASVFGRPELRDTPLIGYQVLAAGDAPRAKRRQYMDAFCDLLAQEIDAAYRQGRLSRPPDPITLRVLVGGVDSLILSYAVDGQVGRFAEAVPLVRELFVRAFR